MKYSSAANILLQWQHPKSMGNNSTVKVSEFPYPQINWYKTLSHDYISNAILYAKKFTKTRNVGQCPT